MAFFITWLTFKRHTNLPFSFRRLFITLTLALITHPLIDAMTVYGTQLFWPIPSPPVVWSTVFVIDPIYTLPLIFTCLWAYWRKLDPRAIRYLFTALLFGCVYFAVGFMSRAYHEHRFESVLTQQGIEVDGVLATPTPLILFCGV